MFKYIVKRILLALLMLLGVSVILYTLVRVMPNNVIEDEYHSTHTNVAVNSAELKAIMIDNNLEDVSEVSAQGRSDMWNVWVGKAKLIKSGKSFIYTNKDRTKIAEYLGKDDAGNDTWKFMNAKTDENGEYILNTASNKDDYKYVYEEVEDNGVLPEKVGGFVAASQSIISGYLQWLGSFMTGDMGTSFKYDQPVADVITRYMGTSFVISLISMVLELIIAIPLGIKCAYNQYGKLDYITTVLTMIGISFPSFFFGSLMIKFFAVDLGWFPVGGMGSSDILDRLWHLTLPILCLTILSIGSMMRYTRTNTLEVLNADYIRTARAKGLSENSVVYKHVFRNTLIPLVTTLAGIIPGLFGGAMITETIFDIQGIGNIAYKAMLAGDVPFIMAYNMFLAVLTVIGILLTDLMYAVVDPRVKLGK